MQKKKLFRYLFINIFFSSLLFGQSLPTANYEYIDTLIKNQKYDIADAKLNEILSTNENDPSALMYKGIIIFYRESLGFNENNQMPGVDNIYEPNYEKESVENTTLSRESAQKISGYFLKALESNPAQINVQLGLCYAFAKAGMIDELVSRFLELKKLGTENEKMQNNMTEYAHIIARQYSLESGLAVFKKITELYPEDGNVLYELGMLYFENGLMDDAIKIFHKAEKTVNLDKNVLENLLLIYSITGDYNRVARTANIIAEQSKDKSDLVYQALEERLEDKAEWKDTINNYLRQTNTRKEINSFASSLKKATRINTFEKFLETAQYNVPASMLAMNYEYGLKQFPDQFESHFNYAEFLTYYAHYNKALGIFKKILERKISMNKEQKEEFNFYYAWALHRTGQHLKSQQYWKQLLESDNFYKKSAASYFLGRYYFNKKDFDQASKYFSYVKDKPEKSKYAEFCSKMYKKINQ